MGLYVNRKTPGIFQKKHIKNFENNQYIFHENHLITIMDEQRELNRQLADSASKSAAHNEAYVRELINQRDIQESMVYSLNTLADSATKSAENNDVCIKGLLNQIAFQETLLQNINKKLQEYDQTSAALFDQLKKQEKMKDAIDRQFDLQDVYHTTLMDRFDDLAAANSKTDRKLEHLTSAMFERASHLSEKLDDQFKKLASFILSLFIKPKIKPDMNFDNLDNKKKIM
ncbi:hypothetical protein J7E71_14035 [Mesobacillus foraminis]|uniref:hypothetical protein n=1 Tax=Mesobacillus foraminis TaxID=279826 RepID=UPI001BE88D05|nr:hypothetical protein [Mesobacillus foraminis]MBT2757063.1 hypothetical protein [Mesobacillus foraminis]